jgi:hypothetical protein
MELLNHSTKRNRAVRAAATILLSLAMLAGTACGPKVIKGRPPFVSISGMSLSGDSLSTSFDISNQNGVEMNIDSIGIEVNVKTTELIRYDSDSSLLVGANSTEEVSVEKTPDDFTRKLLSSLDKGELNSLSFDLQGRAQTVEDGTLRFEYTGYLYPVPGRPGHYRAAVTQAKGLVREKPR